MSLPRRASGQWIVRGTWVRVGDRVSVFRQPDIPEGTTAQVVGVDAHHGIPVMKLLNGPAAGRELVVWPSYITGIVA